VSSNRPLTADVWELELLGDTSSITAPGQFVQVKLPGLFLRRPISVCRWDQDGLTLIYKIVGQGTAQMSRLREGEQLDLLVGLGNGFNVEKCGQRTLLLGGGVGVPPLFGLAQALLKVGKTPVAVLGFNTASECFYVDQFKALRVETLVATVDGSFGQKGFVTDVLPEEYDSFCACGPLPMLKAVCKATNTTGQLSFEERMGCGFGACMGCSIETKSGYKRVCKEGPVLEKEEVLWR
jgi:dihydroorotate dehydrogenase electron transfer subunit